MIIKYLSLYFLFLINDFYDIAIIHDGFPFW